MKKKTAAGTCDSCAYLTYDEEFEQYICDIDMDEDDYARIAEGRQSEGCPFYRIGDEYRVVRHQI